MAKTLSTGKIPNVALFICQAIDSGEIIKDNFVFLQYHGRTWNGVTHLVVAQCLACGGISKPLRFCDIMSGRTRTCGCGYKAHLDRGRRTHGLSRRNGRKTAEWCAWQHMKRRCLNPKVKGYDRYGGRGRRVCQGYRESFALFYKHIGPRPSPRHSCDRKNNNGHYSCGECAECKANGWPMNIRWATDVEQANNTSRNRLVTACGKTQTLAQWLKELGIRSGSYVTARLAKGWPDEEALFLPRGSNFLKPNQDEESGRFVQGKGSRRSTPTKRRYR
jgi:hypothetical protein